MERCEASRPPPAAQAPGLCAWGSLAPIPPCSVQNVGAELWVRLLGLDRCGVCSQLEALPPCVWRVTFDSLWGKRESGKFCNEKLCSTAGVGGIVPNSGFMA